MNFWTQIAVISAILYSIFGLILVGYLAFFTRGLGSISLRVIGFTLSDFLTLIPNFLLALAEWFSETEKDKEKEISFVLGVSAFVYGYLLEERWATGKPLLWFAMLCVFLAVLTFIVFVQWKQYQHINYRLVILRMFRTFALILIVGVFIWFMKMQNLNSAPWRFLLWSIMLIVLFLIPAWLFALGRHIAEFAVANATLSQINHIILKSPILTKENQIPLNTLFDFNSTVYVSSPEHVTHLAFASQNYFLLFIVPLDNQNEGETILLDRSTINHIVFQKRERKENP